MASRQLSVRLSKDTYARLEAKRLPDESLASAARRLLDEEVPRMLRERMLDRELPQIAPSPPFLSRLWSWFRGIFRTRAVMSYREYLGSAQWKRRRLRALRRAGYRCQVCFSSANLQAHHRTYDRRGWERDGDLTVLCDDCHSHFHFRAPYTGGNPVRFKARRK